MVGEVERPRCLHLSPVIFPHIVNDSHLWHTERPISPNARVMAAYSSS